jgi:dehydro coenzyme F420 reductase / coenzyme F420-0:L-glutamate ligase / coenzyme F420-1:gamma-L-glutamate ligase
MKLEILPVAGLPEIEEQDDIASLIAEHAQLYDADVVVVAQKIVSKAEGRVVPVDPARRGQARAQAVSEESVRVVARRGDLVIAQTRHGFVCANAGVDASNVPPDRLALLPLDPDGTALSLRARLLAITGCSVGVIITDTFGRPWRMGQTNVALGVAGVRPLRDHRGEKDAFGMELEATIIAIADEIAGAAELVMGKSDGIPVAIVRGLEGAAGEGEGRELVRPAEEDLFATGGVEAVEARRSIRRFAKTEVPSEVVRRAVQAAATAPAPHGSRVGHPWRFVWLRSAAEREAFLDELARAWRADLQGDGTPQDVIERRIQRSDAILRAAPALLACFVSTKGADEYVEERHARAAQRARGEREMFVAAGGAAVQNLMVALQAQGVGSCWISTTMFCPADARDALGLGPDWVALGCVAAGYAAGIQVPRGEVEIGDVLDIR